MAKPPPSILVERYTLPQFPNEGSAKEEVHGMGRHRWTRYRGSSDLSMVRASSVWSPSVGGKHDSQPIMIKVFESVG
jgi:hypothetical protein